ncbi:hypothetical protein [Thalassotalea aquiviva]|uniref:hypothetical protein n=1 Tax=Thalassotalea aquiviva TaxID=3242415 RepID=UPI00352A6CEB
MNTRKLHRKHKSKHQINFYSRKNGCHVWCESNLERNFALSLEFDGNVICYTTQPGTINVHGRSYTPDFLVMYKSKPAEFIEVKMFSVIDGDDEFTRKFQLNHSAIKQALRLNLVLKTDIDLRKVNLSTLDKLYRFLDVDIRHIYIDEDFPEYTSIAKLAMYLEKNAMGSIHEAWAMVAQKVYAPVEYSNLSYESEIVRTGY